MQSYLLLCTVKVGGRFQRLGSSEKWTQIQAGKSCKLTKEETRH